MYRPQERFSYRGTCSWYGAHIRSKNNIIKNQVEVVLFGDSLVANLGRYPTVCDHYLGNAANCGIPGDHTQNVLWRVVHMHLPTTVSTGIIHCGINDILSASAKAPRPHKIAENVISCGLKLRERHPWMSIIIMGILPVKTALGVESEIEEVNQLLKETSSSHGFTYIDQGSCWRDHCGNIDRSLYWKDGLHINKNGSATLARIYAFATQSAQLTNKSPAAKTPPTASIPPPPVYDADYYSPPCYTSNPSQDLPTSPAINYHRCHNRPRKIRHRNKKYKLTSSIIPLSPSPSPSPSPLLSL